MWLLASAGIITGRLVQAPRAPGSGVRALGIGRLSFLSAVSRKGHMNPDASQPPSLVDLPVTAFLARIANPDPAPGGGSAAALAGALGAALAGMVAGLALKKLSPSDDQGTPAEIAAHAGDLQGRLAALIDEDAAAYGGVGVAYGMPRNTEEEKAARRAAAQQALKNAVATPMATAEGCVAALRLAARAAQVASRSAITDAGTAALLAHAALAASVRNVEANLKGIRDEGFVAETRARALALQDEGKAALAAALAAVEGGA